MPLYESTDSVELTKLIQDISEQRMGLPDFQRSYVWKPAQVVELIASVAQNFPVGTILRVKRGADLGVIRGIEGGPDLSTDGQAVETIVLDGQQRLTSLYCALIGSGPYRYYINIEALREDSDLEDAIVHLHHSRQLARQLGDELTQFDRLYMPLSAIGTRGGYSAWAKRARRYWASKDDTTPAELNHLEDDLDRIERQYIDHIEHYRIPVLMLSNQVSLDAICTIFETINRTGTRLGLFDLLTARFRAHGINLRDEWERTRDSNPMLKDYDR